MKKLILLLLAFTSGMSFSNAQWTPAGIDGDRIQCLAVNGTAIFAGSSNNSHNGNLYFSTNSGVSWTPVVSGSNFSGAYYYSLAVTDLNIFAGTVGVILFRKSGNNWVVVDTSLNATGFSALAISGVNIFAGTDHGEFLSTNNGVSWTKDTNGLGNKTVLSLAVSGTNIFAGTGGQGIYLSTDNGMSWIPINHGLPNNGLVTIYSFAVTGARVFAGTDNGVFLSTDGGNNWTGINTGLPINHGYVINALAVNGNNIFAGTADSGVYLSTNNGSSWAYVGLIDTMINSLAIEGNYIFAGTNGNVGGGPGYGVWKGDITALENINKVAVPTLSQWGLMSLGGLLVLFGVVYVRKIV